MLADKLAEKYSSSSYYQETKAELEKLSSKGKTKQITFPKITYSTSFFHQLKWVSKRMFKNLMGNPQASIAQVILKVSIPLPFDIPVLHLLKLVRCCLGLRCQCFLIFNKEFISFTFLLTEVFTGLLKKRQRTTGASMLTCLSITLKRLWSPTPSNLRNPNWQFPPGIPLIMEGVSEKISWRKKLIFSEILPIVRDSTSLNAASLGN